MFESLVLVRLESGIPVESVQIGVRGRMVNPRAQLDEGQILCMPMLSQRHSILHTFEWVRLSAAHLALLLGSKVQRIFKNPRGQHSYICESLAHRYNQLCQAQLICLTKNSLSAATFLNHNEDTLSLPSARKNHRPQEPYTMRLP